ncbi:MAG: lytic murein transglycosylase [Oligoflexia bacterium]|nr:lytic murein transglycosylase [Oligoflexia bacterium]
MYRIIGISRALSSAVIFFALGGCSLWQSDASSENSGNRANFDAARFEETAAFRGWDYLVNRLKTRGLSEAELVSIYGNARMPKFEHISFSLNPKESSAIYQQFLSPKNIASARAFLTTHAHAFTIAENTFKVNRRAIAAVLLVETRFGKDTGRELVVWKLSRLAGISDPENVRWNFERLRRDDPAVKFEDVQIRAQYLDAIFLPEVEALFQIAKAQNLDLFRFTGSSAGAFGMPQFLPTSYLKFGVDGNRDGVISLFREEDAIHSVANFLSKSGWDNSNPESQKNALWKYNRSSAYVGAVLKIAELLAPRKSTGHSVKTVSQPKTR